MLNINVRCFEDKDAEPVSRILFDSFKSFLGDRLSEEDRESPERIIKSSMAKSQDVETVSFVAEINDEIIGYLCVTANLKRGLGILNRIGVDPNRHGAGIGRALFKYAEDFWTKHGMRKIYTCVSSINPQALAFYQKRGFQQEGILKDHFFNGVDEIQLARFLEK